MHTRQRTGPAAPSSKPCSPCSLAWPRRLLLLGNEEETMAGTAALCRPRDGDQTNLQAVIRGGRHNAKVGIIVIVPTSAQSRPAPHLRWAADRPGRPSKGDPGPPGP